ncbi:hypothetical protein BHE74_00032279 [Ensete ventricosum]|nr:hypothetical protein GW17_00027859 [Ensete ventricosum]RWW60698.1 hypothetical protein BHE74_00032279 [Ensete ventricosum]
MAVPPVMAEGAAAAALRTVLQRVRQAAERSGRRAEGVRVVAVGKTKPVSLVRRLYDVGHRCFGENYVQEIVEKAPQVPRLPIVSSSSLPLCLEDSVTSDKWIHQFFLLQLPLDIEWHFIGHLQSNKVKSLLGIFQLLLAVELLLYRILTWLRVLIMRR